MSLYLTHHDDGKQKYHSHEIELREDNFYNAKYDLFSHNLFDCTGYGQTQEEAIEDFKTKFTYLMNELKAFEDLLLDTSLIEDSIRDVDCFGNELNKTSQET